MANKTPHKKLRLTADREAKIREDHAAGISQRATARALGVPNSIISRWGKRLGLTYPTQATAAATEDVRARIAAKRAKLAEDALDDAIKLRERIWESYELIVSAPMGPERMHLDLPDAKGVRNFTESVNKLIVTHENLVRLGATNATEQAQSVLAGMQAALQKLAAEVDQ